MRLTTTGDELDWVEKLDTKAMMATLAAYGRNLGGYPESATADEDANSFLPRFQVFPLGDRWWRIGSDDDGNVMAQAIPNPAEPDKTDGVSVQLNEIADDLHGWFTARSEINGTASRWISVLRRPEREAYAALLYEAAESGPRRLLTLLGVYPDITLAADGSRLAFVKPDGPPGGQKAIIANADPELFESTQHVISESSAGGISVAACSLRRFVKLSRGVRSVRVWDLVDTEAPEPFPLPVPGTPCNQNLIDVGLLANKPVLLQADNIDDEWHLRASAIEPGGITRTWDCARGRGTAIQLKSQDDHALLRVSLEGQDWLHRVTLHGFSNSSAKLVVSPGLLDVSANTVAPSVGLTATEMTGGAPPFFWFWDAAAQLLNTSEQLASRAASQIRSVRERISSADGFQFDLDIRWSTGESFTGPVILMLYGAYGLDIDLDSDPDLDQWLTRGYAVATAHVRGGGAKDRHLAGTKTRRHRSVADAVAAVRHLRSGAGAVKATHIVTLGASAGGFLSAATFNACPDEVDVCVVVNGFVDPLSSLMSKDSSTQASDEDEWGNPQDLPHHREALLAVSPVHNLPDHPKATALVIVSAQDARVNPRQGLKWYLRYRALGGNADLWYDPQGAHDCWGMGMPRTALVDWISSALAEVKQSEAS